MTPEGHARAAATYAAIEDQLLERLAKHRKHPPADSLHGRCTVCYLTWGDQRRATDLEAERAGPASPPEPVNDLQAEYLAASTKRDHGGKAASWLGFSVFVAIAVVGAYLIGFELLADTGWGW